MSSAVREDYEFGDFQTPLPLAARIWDAIDLDGITHVVEPTVGIGNFLRTAPSDAISKRWFAFDVNPTYVERAEQTARSLSLSGTFDVKSAFDLRPADFPGVGAGSRVLVIGNPPWVTNAGQGAADLANLPTKTNRFNLAGLAAMTGKANFDIAEAILLAVLDALRSADEVRLALLIKRSVALKVAEDLMSAGGATALAFARVDAKRWFNASVEAGLLEMTWRRGAESAHSMSIYTAVGQRDNPTAAGIVNGRFVQRLDEYHGVDHVEAASPAEGLPWRQGIKHDAAKLLELRVTPDGVVNGLGDIVDVEDEVLSPFYKSSDLANGRPASRLFPFFQHDLKGPDPDLDRRWPRLAAYLRSHRATFDARRSRIYHGKPPYMLFGVGPYTAAPFKVAVSGLYKAPRFAAIGPGPDGQPPLVDDTCNLLPFSSLDAARQTAEYLNGPDVQRFLAAIADPTSKRPYKVDVLRRIRAPGYAPRELSLADILGFTV